jgi:hypothetical protein
VLYKEFDLGVPPKQYAFPQKSIESGTVVAAPHN